MIVNSANLRILGVAVVTAFNKGLESEESHWQKVAMDVPSNTSGNTYAWLGAMSGMREWIGDRVINNLTKHEYTVKNRKFENTWAIGRDEIEDDQYGIYMPAIQDSGFSAKTHSDQIIYGEVLMGGFENTCYDGQNFFDSDHPVGNDATGIKTVSNMQDGTDTPWFLLDMRRPIKPLIRQLRRDYQVRSITDLNSEHVMMKDEFVFGVDARMSGGYGLWQLAFGSKATLNETNFTAAFEAMESQENDYGQPLNVQPSLMVTGPGNRAAAEALLKQKQKSGSDNINYNRVELLIVPWIK